MRAVKLFRITLFIAVVGIGCSKAKKPAPGTSVDKKEKTITAPQKKGIDTPVKEETPQRVPEQKHVAVQVKKSEKKTRKKTEHEKTVLTEKSKTSGKRDAPLSVRRSVLCSGIENREPSGLRKRFKVNEQAYYFTEVTGGRPGRYIYHVWSYEGAEKFRLKLSVSHTRHRTWSRKKLYTRGEWQAAAVGDDGTVLDRRILVVE